jgi:hypothetical protein
MPYAEIMFSVHIRERRFNGTETVLLVHVSGCNLTASVYNYSIFKRQRLMRGVLQYTDQEMIPARNARNVGTLAEVMFVTIQRENILPSKITD